MPSATPHSPTNERQCNAGPAESACSAVAAPPVLHLAYLHPHPTGLGDLLLLTLLRGCLVMLPLLGLSATLPWLAAAVTIVAALTGWLAAKVALLHQLAAGHRSFLVQETGVTLHLPTLLAAEALGVFMAWFLLALVWVNRRVMQQPAAGDPIMVLQSRTAAAMQQQRMAVEEWVVSHQEPEGVGPELTAPLLAAAAAEEGKAGMLGHVGGDGELEAYRSAQSRQLSSASWVTAPESPPVDAPLGAGEL